MEIPRVHLDKGVTDPGGVMDPRNLDLMCLSSELPGKDSENLGKTDA